MRIQILLIFGLIFFLSENHFTQSPTLNVDSLIQELTAMPDDTTTVQLLHQISNNLIQKNRDLAKAYGKKAVLLAQKIGDERNQAMMEFAMIELYMRERKTDSMRYYINQALPKFKELNDKKYWGTTIERLAKVEAVEGNPDQSFKYLLEASRLYNKSDMVEEEMAVYAIMVKVLVPLGRLEEGNEYALKSYHHFKKTGNEPALASVANDIGFISLELEKSQEALGYLSEAIDIFEKFNQSIPAAVAYQYKGMALYKSEEYGKALNNYDKAMEIAKAAGIPGLIKNIEYNLAFVHSDMDNHELALPLLLKIFKENQGREIEYVDQFHETLSGLAAGYAGIEQYDSAHYYLNWATNYKDSLELSTMNQEISELKTEFETEKKEQLIQEQKNSLAQSEKIQYLSFSIAGLLAFFLAGLFYFFRKNQQTNILLNQQNNLIEKKNAQNELLLKEIHHRVKNNLETVSSLLALQSASIEDPTVLDAMKESQNRVQSMGMIHQKLYQGENLASIEMKDYFINLSEGVLDSFGAENRIQIECAMKELELDVDTAVPIGLIVNELLTNSLKYAFPDGRKGQIKISLKEVDEEHLELSIADNGIGKNIVSNQKTKGFGTQLIQLLARQINGKLEEIINQGTMISLTFKKSKFA